MSLIKLKSERPPTEFGYMIVENVVFNTGEHIRPPTRILLINTKIGKYWVVSDLKGRICEPPPEIGESLNIDDAVFLSLEIDDNEACSAHVTFDKAIGTVELLE